MTKAARSADGPLTTIYPRQARRHDENARLEERLLDERHPERARIARARAERPAARVDGLEGDGTCFHRLPSAIMAVTHWTGM